MKIIVFEKTGRFAENKDAARDMRINDIFPSLKNGEEVILDFINVSSATQSFIHALISDAIREFGSDVLDKIIFKHCNASIKELIKTVAIYVQAGLGNDN
ncbi:MAG: STAS-like domain-containing protein [Candidatus Peribacter sp.]|nr:STAS-like domain-containing protein [Candidatus Peribacter sp.]